MIPTELLNAWAAWWAVFMLGGLMDTIFLLALVALVWLLLRRWASPQFGYCLFLAGPAQAARTRFHRGTRVGDMVVAPPYPGSSHRIGTDRSARHQSFRGVESFRIPCSSTRNGATHAAG